MKSKIEKDLYTFLSLEYRPGVLGIIRASVGRIIQKLESLLKSLVCLSDFD